MAGRWVDVGEAVRELGISTAQLSVSAASVTAKHRCLCSSGGFDAVDQLHCEPMNIRGETVCRFSDAL
jgi:hypothetical protein